VNTKFFEEKPMSAVIERKFGIFEIDLEENKMPTRTACYLIRDEKNVIIETGPSPSNDKILTAIERQGLTPDDIDMIIVTHIHLDHAGGAGLLLSQCKNATLYVHYKGLPHLVDPTKLIGSAKAVYGDNFIPFFDPILPADGERTQALNEGDKIAIGPNRELEIWETPGHALIHNVIYDPASNGFFTGDSGGVYFRIINDLWDVPFVIPSTSPTQFDPKAMDASYQRMLDKQPERLYFTHFGMAEPAMDYLQQAKDMVPLFGQEAVDFYQKERSQEKLQNFIQQSLYDKLEAKGVPTDRAELACMDLDINLNTQGIIAYVRRLEKSK